MDSGRRKVIAGLAGFAAPTLIGTSVISQTPEALGQGVTAYKSDSLADAIGINTHLNWRDTIWGKTQAWRQALLDLGVRYHRTSLGALADAKADFLWLWANGGIKGLMMCSRIVQVNGVGPTYNNEETARYIKFLRDQIGFGKVIGIEGPNEPNNPKVATSGWALRTRDHQKWLYDFVSAVSGNTLPVLSPSVYRRIPADCEALSQLSDRSNIANLHNYTAGRMPNLGVEGSDGAATETSLDAVMARARAVTPEKPLWVTEYGHDCSNVPTLQKPWVMSEAASARYLLRGIALKFKKGATRISVYSLLDDAGSGDSYGLLASTSDYELTPRPSYHALQRFISCLSDPGADHSPQPLNYAIAGDQTNVETLLLQKRDGTWFLLIWQEVSLWDRQKVRDVVPQLRSLTLTLPFYASITAYEPSERKEGAVLTAGAQNVDLKVPGHILVLQINEVPRPGLASSSKVLKH